MDLLVKNILIKVALGLVKFCSVYTLSSDQASVRFSISHALEYLHKQQYLIGIARAYTYYYKCDALFKIYLMYVLQCLNEWGVYYTLMNVGYAHTI